MDPTVGIVAVGKPKPGRIRIVGGHEILQCEAELVQIADAFNLLRLFFGEGNRRQQQRGKDGDNADYDQQLQ